MNHLATEEFDLEKFIEEHEKAIQAIREDYLAYYAGFIKEPERLDDGIYRNQGVSCQKT